jgi:RNA polymerase sigma-70 factor (ECF subfamily)
MRRRARFEGAQRDLAANIEARINKASPITTTMTQRSRTTAIFTCCRPALPPEGQVALSLREICGLTTEEIARAFLVTLATLAQRIVRAKAVIRDKAIPYQERRKFKLNPHQELKKKFTSLVCFLRARRL